MFNLPKQRQSYEAKSKNNFAWAKEVIDSILSYTPTSQGVINAPTSDYQRKLSNYQLYNNELNQADFERECNPLGLDVGQFKDTIQPYNKTYNKIQILLSDLTKRPFNYRAILVNSEGVRSKLFYRDTLFKQYIEKVLLDAKQTAMGLMPEDSEDTLIDPKDVSRYMRYDYRERRELLTQALLQYFSRALDIKDLKVDTFKHALIAGEEIVYVGTENGEPKITVVNPLGFFCHKSAETKWIQDSLYAGYKTYMTVSEVLDRYGKYLSEDQKEQLDTNTGTTNPVREFTMGATAKYGNSAYDPILDIESADHGSYGKRNTEDILVSHVEWVSQRKVGFIEYQNEFGETESKMVSEDFEIPTIYTKEVVTRAYGAKTTYFIWEVDGVFYKLNWDYIPEVWTGTKIGHNIYTMIGPKELQYRSVDNPYKVSLGYHGIIYNAMNAGSVSLMDRMKPFQYLYFIVMHKLKELIAQDQGKVFPFDISMVDPKIGLEKTLYYLKRMNIDLYNSLANGDMPGQSQRGKVTGVADMSNMQHILNYISILSAIDAQISEVAGVSRQREGQTTPTEAVSNAQSNIMMSALITEIYFQTHAKLWEKILSSLVYTAKYAWKGQKIIKQYVLDDLSLATLEMDADELLDCDLGIFVTDSGKEHEMFQALKGISDGLLNTNRATFSDLITLYESNSVAELKHAIKQSEETTFARESENQQAAFQASKEEQKAQQEFELLKQQLEHEHKERLAQIEVFKFQQDLDIDNNGIPDPLEVQKFLNDAKNDSRKLDIEEKKLAQDKELREKEIKERAKKASKKT